jgi:MFS family permease
VQAHDTWDVRYEWRAVLLLTIGFGLVGLDRFALNPVFPAMMRELHLTYQDLGNASAALSLAWGVTSMWIGRISDRLGRRKILIGTVLAFSCTAGFTGLAAGSVSLLLLRLIMGVSEGAFIPASFVECIEASKPSRRGFNFGLQQNGLPLIGLTLGPIIATQLLTATGSWRLVFAVVALPGLLLAYFMGRILRDVRAAAGPIGEASREQQTPRWRDALRYPNVIVACLILSFVGGTINVVLAMTPSYLVDYLKIAPQRMGFIMSTGGLGAIAGGFLLPGLSDRFGRRPVLLGCIVAACFAIWAVMRGPDHPLRLFLLMASLAGVVYINNGPLTVEAVPAPLATTAVGLVVGIGEIVGGGVATPLAGFVAQHFGVQHVYTIASACMLAAVASALFLRAPHTPVGSPAAAAQ